MTEPQAEKAANIVIGLFAIGAIYALARVPHVRRGAWNMTKLAFGAAGPWLIAEARRAWDRSGAMDPETPAAGAGGIEPARDSTERHDSIAVAPARTASPASSMVQPHAI